MRGGLGRRLELLGEIPLEIAFPYNLRSVIHHLLAGAKYSSSIPHEYNRFHIRAMVPTIYMSQALLFLAGYRIRILYCLPPKVSLATP